MEEKKEDIKHVLNWDSQKIWKEEIISKKFVKHLKEKEVRQLIKDKEVRIGIIRERGIIKWAEKEKNGDLWFERIESHICENIIKDDDDYFARCEYEDFSGEYFYVASLWETEPGEKLIILEYYY